MRTEKLDSILATGVTRDLYRGTFPSDVDFHFQPPYCCITNVDSHNGKGSHWNAWFVTKDVIFFFDSFGRRPIDATFPNCYRQFVKNRKYAYNPRIVQGLFSDTCGHFCIYVLHYVSLNYNWKDIMNSFTNDLHVNDMNMRKFVDRL